MTRRRDWFAWRVVATVVLLGLLVAGGFAVHRLGWSQGYAAAELSAGGEEAPTPPLAPPGWRPAGFVYRPLGGLLVTLLLGLILLSFAGKLLRVVLWGAMAGPAMAGPWRHHWHRMHGPLPPWYGPWCQQHSERPQESDDQASAEV
jgi:hypothetical protein